MTIDSADDSKISNQTINTNRISNRAYDSKSNRITKLRRSLNQTETIRAHSSTIQRMTQPYSQSLGRQEFIVIMRVLMVVLLSLY